MDHLTSRGKSVLTEFKLRYNPALDGLRGIAIVLVLLSHAHVPLFDGAFLGVDLFFVLSGYLITSLLLIEWHTEGRLDYWRFYRRRFFRLMPALALFLAAYVLFAPLFWPDLDDIYQDALVSLLYLADYGIAFFDSPDTLLHMWSLAVEEHFYLIWPPLLALLVRKAAPGKLWRTILLLWVLAWAWRIFWVFQGQQFYEIFFRFDTRATGLLAGSLLAALLHERTGFAEAIQSRLHHVMWLPLAIPLLMSLGWDNQDAMLWGITVVECAAIVILVAVQRQGLIYDMLTAPALVQLGRLSYGIYLWHYPVVRYLRAEFSWPVVLVLGLAISAALAALSFYTVERWALRWRDAPRKERPANVPAHARQAMR
ncbi:acyltransferase [Comamonas aquatica]|uniref:Acyltransferase n=1 Tax=Comamonas aquatica TaxID=225991 RepID=A0AA42W068_9BURK|nr:acyltransferase [Comamonas aquatica]MDH1427678.1 acyltransferase [Comamonas aquatica]MDH1604474.1 acyltransferase [Comamonas aquatica]MDH1616635.1 acyltransferase [Comamonas aquatica]MDH2004215.1 acyltransferase [Comamonas aquatica]